MTLLEKLKREKRLTVNDAMKILGVTRFTIDDYMRTGSNGIRLPASKIGGRVVIFEHDLENWLEEINAPLCGDETPAATRTESQVLKQSAKIEAELVAAGY